MEPEFGHDLQRGQAVGDAAAEVDARGFVEVPDRDRDITELEAEVDGLGEELGVKGEVVGVPLERDLLEHSPAVCSETAVEVA